MQHPMGACGSQHRTGQPPDSWMGAQNSNQPTANCIRLGRLNQRFGGAGQNWSELALSLPLNGKLTL